MVVFLSDTKTKTIGTPLESSLLICVVLFCCFVVLRSKTKAFKQTFSNKSIQTNFFKQKEANKGFPFRILRYCCFTT